jgi:DNA polymerase
MPRGLFQIALRAGADQSGFQAACRNLAAQGVPPDCVVWSAGEETDLFGLTVAEGAPPLMLPRAALSLIRSVVCHSAPERYALLYALVWRLTHKERSLLEIPSDPIVHRLQRLSKAVRRDVHKMHAFVRFRQIRNEDEAGFPERFLAWFEPDHWIVEAAAPFFVDRFRGMQWAISTPRGSLCWDTHNLAVLPPRPRSRAPANDDFESHWLDYYESIFNPARLNAPAMRNQMAVKYWKNLPEAASIRRLVREAPSQMQAMIDREAKAPTKRNPDKAVAAMTDQAPGSLEALNRQILQSEPPAPFSPRAVLGAGPVGARIALVGEQPGDQEDMEGLPFVGPAGRLLDSALAEAGLQRSEIYVTNAVKHFKFKPVGKRRIHQTPTAGEIKHYRWWLELELDLVKPHLVVAMGASATLALAGRPLPVLKSRGPSEAFRRWPGYITVHPSSLLRQTDEAARTEAYLAFVADLSRVKQLAA